MLENNKKFSTTKLLQAIREIPPNLISYKEKHILNTLLSCMNSDNDTWHSMESIANFSSMSFSSVYRHMKPLEQKKFIIINRPLHYARYATNHYSLNIKLIMSFSVDKSVVNLTTDEKIGIQSDYRNDEIGIQSDIDRYSSRHTKKEKKKEIKDERESARKKRVPLTDSFLPNEKTKALLKEVSNTSNKSTDQLLTKFKNLQKSKDALSADWNAELENFLINERPMGYTNGNGHKSPETKSAVLEWGPGHPSYDMLKAADANPTKLKKPEKEEEKKPVVYESFAEVKKRYELSLLKQQGALPNGDLSRDQSGRSSRN